MTQNQNEDRYCNCDFDGCSCINPRALLMEVLEEIEEIGCEIDVEKEPTIPEEAWANQYENKCEAFWYGEREGLKVLEKVKEIIEKKITHLTNKE